MISRVAEQCFWFGRYVERAESTARLLGATRTLVFDADLPVTHCWQPLVIVSGEYPAFCARFGAEAAGDGEHVQEYLTWSPENGVSLVAMVRAARECARVVLGEGLDKGLARHRLASGALRAGLEAMRLELFGDPRHRMANVTGIVIPQAIGDSEKVRREMLTDFGIEIGTSFGPLVGKIWRIGTMGYVCRKASIMRCLTALEAVLRRNGLAVPAGAAVDAAYEVYAGT